MDILELKRKIRGKSFKAISNILSDSFEIVDKFGKNKGVYLIEDFYIGRSKNIKNRIVSHIKELLELSNKDIYIPNREKLFLIRSILRGRKLKVVVLDEDEEKEEFWIKNKYKSMFLTNIEFIDENLNKDRKDRYNLIPAKESSEHFYRKTIRFKKYKNKIFIGGINGAKEKPKNKKHKESKKPPKNSFWKFIAVKYKDSNQNKIIINSDKNENLIKRLKGQKKGFDEMLHAECWLKEKFKKSKKQEVLLLWSDFLNLKCN